MEPPTPKDMSDLEALWKDKEPAKHGSRTPPLVLARQFGDSIRRLDILLGIKGVKQSLVASEGHRSDIIQDMIDVNITEVCQAIQMFYVRQAIANHKLKHIKGNIPYFCREISNFISGENPPW